MAATDHLHARFAVFRDTQTDQYDRRISDSYEAFSGFDEKFGVGDSVISAKVEHNPGHSLTWLPNQGTGGDFQRFAQHQEHVSGARPDPAAQQRLFAHQSERPYHQVESLYADVRSRASVVPLLGVIQNRAREMTGQDVRQGHSLSRHSGTLVEHILGEGSRESKTNNSMTWKDSSRIANTVPSDGAQELSPQEWGQGRSTGRSLARRRVKPLDQGALF